MHNVLLYERCTCVLFTCLYGVLLYQSCLLMCHCLYAAQMHDIIYFHGDCVYYKQVVATVCIIIMIIFIVILVITTTVSDTFLHVLQCQLN